MKCYEVRVKRALSYSALENVEYSLNPYIGCSHGCIYCYSPYFLKKDPIIFKENIGVKINVPLLLQKEIKNVKGRIFIGSITDPYQPCESKYGITRNSIEIILKNKKFFTILTKSDLIIRDKDLLDYSPFAEVGFTINTLDESKKSLLEPNSPSVERVINALDKINTRKYVMIAPIYNSLPEEIYRMFDLFSKKGAEYIIMDKFRYRNGMSSGITKHFLIDEKIKEIAIKISREVGIPVYFSF